MKKDENTSNFQKKLLKQASRNRLRELRPLHYEAGRKRVRIAADLFLNFCSNDYLGLSVHPELIRRSVDYTERYGTSSSSSRLVSGSLQIHHDLEEKIAALYSAEACLLFGNGFLANTTLLSALTDRGDHIIADKLCHNSIIQGGMLSRGSFVRFRHNDCSHLENLLRRYRKSSSGECWVVTESLFSMDGDMAPLDEISSLCRQYGAYLMIDDAHAFGVWGDNGLGLAAGRRDVDLLLGTLGKAGGGYGAFAVCSSELKDYLVNFCAGVIYTTAPPPSVIGAADAAFDLVPAMNDKRDSLKKTIKIVLRKLKHSGFDTGAGMSQILPLLVDGEEEAMELRDRLYEKRIFVQAIRPPTVSRSRLRITLSAEHHDAEIQELLEALNE